MAAVTVPPHPSPGRLCRPGARSNPSIDQPAASTCQRSRGAAEFTAEQYRAKQPGGRAFLHAAEYQPSPEVPSDEYPLMLTTGRTVHQFHTRTKTARGPQLNAAAPEVWVEIHPDDAEKYGIADGDLAGLASPRGGIEARARIGGTRPGTVFVPFHYGFDVPADRRTPRAANELTVTWDPVSKQPLFKVTAVRIGKLR
ncbi:molybdopterin oxidoreductase family protein [Actinoplanes siamensis]|uniref:Molybdopterin dinucleotide-binding domain-containing protein n=1 Tax=Actinoplanes siamensis TaxID=1223317 RepID=A0A919TP06_9ACTN|nr:molybdopterin dinucleotide binding domain-containing protein [Actinoplanes siamensis]GIF09277.1 hypothetical protein Asi03nite_68150 [Actinoplanes siamensis]